MEKVVPLVFQIKRLAVHDGPGARTTVFLKGCPFRCVWCHNPESQSAAPQLAYYEHRCVRCGLCVGVCPHGAHSITSDGRHLFTRDSCRACGACADVCTGNALQLYGRRMTAEEVAEAVLQDKPFYEASGGGVTLSGGEPLLYPDFCADVFTRLKVHGVSTAIDTSAAVGRRAFLVTAPVTDLYLVDVKHPFSDAHRALTGFGNEAVWENLSLLAELSKDVEIRIPIIPGVNDGDAEIKEAAKRLREIAAVKRVRLLPYRDLARSKYAALGMQDTMPHVPTPTPEEMEAYRIRFASYGLETVV